MACTSIQTQPCSAAAMILGHTVLLTAAVLCGCNTHSCCCYSWQASVADVRG